MVIKVIIVIVVLLIIRDILASLLGWGSDAPRTPAELLGDIKHNRKIDRQWKKDGCPIVETTFGWRPDPYGVPHQDGMKNNGDGSYSRLISGGTKAYREKFAADVEKASHEPTLLG